MMSLIFLIFRIFAKENHRKYKIAQIVGWLNYHNFPATFEEKLSTAEHDFPAHLFQKSSLLISRI